jgi:hypothetical protein
MKKILVISFILTANLLGCQSHAPRPLTDTEKNDIIEAVIATAHAIGDAVNQINFPNFKNFFMESPDFMTVTPRGKILNYDQYMKSEQDFFESVSTLQLSIVNESAKVLERTLAVYTVQLKVNAILKSGKKLTFDNIVYTEIYRKSGDQWKIIYVQEAGQPAVVTGP